jgi:hypothetical protein
MINTIPSLSDGLTGHREATSINLVHQKSLFPSVKLHEPSTVSILNI